MKCTQPHPGFELESPCPFLMTIVITSQGPRYIYIYTHTHTHTHTHIYIYIYIYIYIKLRRVKCHDFKLSILVMHFLYLSFFFNKQELVEHCVESSMMMQLVFPEIWKWLTILFGIICQKHQYDDFRVFRCQSENSAKDSKRVGRVQW